MGKCDEARDGEGNPHNPRALRSHSRSSRRCARADVDALSHGNRWTCREWQAVDELDRAWGCCEWTEISDRRQAGTRTSKFRLAQPGDKCRVHENTRTRPLTSHLVSNPCIRSTSRFWRTGRRPLALKSKSRSERSRGQRLSLQLAHTRTSVAALTI